MQILKYNLQIFIHLRFVMICAKIRFHLSHL